jgi:putative acetyltransferase
MIEIRDERPGDADAVRLVNLAAFQNGPEAAVVDKLRQAEIGFHSFVALGHGEVVGHILFTPVTIDGNDAVGAGLAPLAVSPGCQRHGIGSGLVRHGLERMRSAGYPFVVVLGHPAYYPRFGFERASHYGLRSQWAHVPDDAFMVVVYQPDALPKAGGIVRYRSEFDECT